MATQYANASYQEIIDLHTESDVVTALGIHTPQGDTPRKMFPGFFEQFKKFKYLGASLTLVPAARLPVDPLGVSYDAGEPTIDPRDVLNPILWHGCHGNDMGAILNRLYGAPTDNNASDSMDVYDSEETTAITDYVGTLQALYYRALTDNTWKKAHPQKGFKKSGLRPLVYDLATTRQIAPGVLDTYLGPAGEDGVGHDLLGAYSVDANGEIRMAGDPAGGAIVQNYFFNYVNRQSPQFITPRLTSLGWLDTRNVLMPPFNFLPEHGGTAQIGKPSLQTDIALSRQNDTELPKIFMGIILLPPAYKTEQYFRLIINHHFGFKGFRGASMDNSLVGFGTLPDNVVNLNPLQNSNDSNDNGVARVVTYAATSGTGYTYYTNPRIPGSDVDVSIKVGYGSGSNLELKWLYLINDEYYLGTNTSEKRVVKLSDLSTSEQFTIYTLNTTTLELTTYWDNGLVIGDSPVGAYDFFVDEEPFTLEARS